MTYEDACARLRNHSNLTDGPRERSLTLELRQAERSDTFPRLSEHVDDVLACLAAVNLGVNGPVPSKSTEPGPGIPRELSYAISGILVAMLSADRRLSASQCWSAADVVRLREAALKVTMAWDMVLAGDHDDLLAELQLEWDLTA